MKQQEKNKLSKEKILQAAIYEFGKNGYAGASLNTFLSNNGLSKGLVYHYFKNKDQIYLECASACFNLLTQELSSVEYKGSAQNILKSYFNARSSFFKENPMLESIFFDAILSPPAGLTHQLKQIRSDFDAFNCRLFEKTLSGLYLRSGVSEETALYYFNLMQNALHFQLRTEKADYEQHAYKIMELLLYGIAEGEKQ